MPQPNKIPLAFAASGDKNVIPESTETTGLASWRDGFPAITSVPFSEGGIAPKRADFNGIFNALSQAVMWMQQGGVYAYDVNTDYEAGNVVLDVGGMYVANAGNGPSSVVVQPSSDTTGATWKLVRLDLATQSVAGYMSAADKTKVDSVILTNATQSAAGYMSAEDKTALDGIPTTYLPRSGGTMTGNITLGGTNPVISTGAATEYLRLNNGVYSDGASLYIYGKSHPTYPGKFWLTALDANNNAQLEGSPDGDLKWDGNDVEVVSAKNLGAVGYVYYKSGLQICWGFNTSPTTGGTGNAVTYPRAFKTSPTTFVTRRSGANTTGPVDLPWVREPTATGMNVYVPTYTGYFWLAIGEGA